MDEATLWPTDAGDYELLGLIGHVGLNLGNHPLGSICESLQGQVQGQ